jgi:type IV secretory pathway VirB10-like protein
MAQVLGMKIPDDLQAKLDAIIQRKDEARQKIAEQTQKTMPPTGQTNPVPNDPNAQENTPEMVAQKAALTGELEKYKRKASKRPGEVVDFESAVIPVEMMTAIKAALPGCKTAQEVRDVFNKLMVEDQPIRVDWVTELKRANDLLEKSMNA